MKCEGRAITIVILAKTGIQCFVDSRRVYLVGSRLRGNDNGAGTAN